MTHPMHSDACKCECDQLAQRIISVIEIMESTNGEHNDLLLNGWILALENALQGDNFWNKISEVVRYLDDL